MALRPWSKFYWADWRADPRLRMCSLAARGLWVELCGLAHEAEPYGHVLVESMAPTVDQLAMLAGAPRKVVVAALAELETAGVFSRTQDGVIYSRRMVRDKEREQEGRESANRRWGSGEPNRSPTPDPITPEARSQNNSPLAGEKFDGGSNGVPNGWQCPRDVAEQLSAATGLSGADIEREAAKFQANAKSKGLRFTDIGAGFRLWCLRDNGRGRGGEREPGAGSGNRRSRVISRADAAREVIAEGQAKRPAERAKGAGGGGERGEGDAGGSNYIADAGFDGPLRLQGPARDDSEDGDSGLGGRAGAIPVFRGEGGLPSMASGAGSTQTPATSGHSGEGGHPVAVLPRTVADGESTSPPVVLRTAP